MEETPGCSPEEVRNIEQKYLDCMNWEESFNVCKDSRGGAVTEEANDRRRESLKNFYRKNPEAITGSNNPFFGKEHTCEAKLKISEKNTGKVRSEEFKREKSQFMSARRGKHHSQEHREALKEKYKGGGNPAAKPVTIGGVDYPTKKAALEALGLKYNYQLDKFLKA